MLELCGILLILVLVTVVGHLIWVGLAAFFRLIAASGNTDSPVEKCPGCDRRLSPGLQWCRYCGLDRNSPQARELAELAAITRRLQQFQVEGVLDVPTLKRLQDHIVNLRQSLIAPARQRPAPAAEVVEQAAPPPVLVALTPREELEELLKGCADVRNLTLGNRLRAVALYRQLADDALTPEIHWQAARLLARSAFVDEAAQAYRRLLRSGPQFAGYAEAALEAGRWLAERDRDQARWFLERARPAATRAQTRDEVERLLQQLMPAQAVTALPKSVEYPETASARQTASQSSAQAAPALVAQPTAPLPPAPPRRSLTELLGAFMEERNILWGELVGGLLMVGCSIALVIYLWRYYQDFPYFPFLIFSTIIAALFAAGLYALERLKLGMTGRGLLIIATLLVPLDFLVMAGRARVEPGSIVQIGLEIAAFALFAFLVRWSARGLTPEGPSLLTFSVLVSSASQLVVSRFMSAETATAPFLALGLLPVAGHAAGCYGFLLRLWKQELTPARTHALFAFLGMSTFAVAVVLGFLIYQSAAFEEALHHAALLIALAAVPVLSGGITVHRGLAQQPEQAGLRTAGTALVAVGIAFLVGAMFLAWPEPLPLVVVSALDFAVLSFLAFRYRLPIIHAAALPALTVGYLTVASLLGDSDHSLLRAFTSSESGVALLYLAALLGLLSEGLVRRSRLADGAGYVCGAAAIGAYSLIVTTADGALHPDRALLAYGTIGLGCLAFNLRWRLQAASYAGLVLLAGATLWALGWRLGRVEPMWTTVIAAQALLMSLLALVLDHVHMASGGRQPPDSDEEMPDREPPGNVLHDLYRQPLAHVGGLSAVLALCLLLSVAWHAGWHTATFGLLAATTFVLAWCFRLAPLTWIGSALLLGALLHGWHGCFPDWPRHRFISIALLSHASAVLLADLSLRSRSTSPAIRRLLTGPLGQSAMVTTILALLLQLLVGRSEPLEAAILIGWLSALWLLRAAMQRSHVMFSAFQGALSLTALFAVAAWLDREPLTSSIAHWQAYAIALAGLSLFWGLVRIALRHRDAVAWLNPPGAPFDVWMLRLLVPLQLAVAICGYWPGVARELSPVPLAFVAADVLPIEPRAWALLAVLALALLALLWANRARDAVLGLVVVAVTVPVLIAGQFWQEQAILPALRWGLSLCFLSVSALIWLRGPLGELGKALKWSAPPAGLAARSRALLLLLTVLPVLALTALAAGFRLLGMRLPGPHADTFFAEIGMMGRYLVPLAVISLGLVGHALRERSAGFAFAAGALVNVTAVGGYALSVAISGQPWQELDLVRLVLIATLAAATWAIAWLAVPWLARAWPVEKETPDGRRLMRVQLGTAVIGVALLLGLGTAWLIAGWSSIWMRQAGSAGSWVTLLWTLAAGWLWLRRSRARMSLHWLGCVGLAFIALVACTIETRHVGWGYRTLMLGLAGYALSWSLTTDVKRQRLRRLKVVALKRTVRSARSAASLWVPACGAAALLLAVKAAAWHDDPLWAALAVALASPAGLIMAVRRRREAWALASGAGFCLAASLAVCWYAARFDPPTDWWVYLLQANGIAMASASLLWLRLRQRIYRTLQFQLSLSPLLAFQVLLGFVFNLLLVGMPLLGIVLFPDAPSPTLEMWGGLGGWLSLYLAGAAALWYTALVVPASRIHYLALLGLATGVLVACALSPFDAGDWLSFHALTVVWCLTGLLLLAAGWISAAASAADTGEEAHGLLDRIADLLRADRIRRWVAAIGLLVVLLAIRGVTDPTGPYASAGATLVVSLLLGGVALWSSQLRWVYVSGLLFNVAGLLIWLQRGSWTLPGFVSCHALCLGAAAAFWTAMEVGLRAAQLPINLRGRGWPFSHLALPGGLILLALNVAGGLALALNGLTPEVATPLAWIAWLALIGAAILSLWDADTRICFAGIYALGLIGLGLGLLALDLDPRPLLWTASLLLAGGVLLSATLAWFAPRWSQLWEKLQVPVRSGGWPWDWFDAAQAGIGAGAALLSLWIVLDFASVIDRLAAPLVLVLLLPEVVRSAKFGSKLGSREAAFVIAALAAVELGWALLAIDAALALHRSVLLAAIATLVALVYRYVLRKFARRGTDWSDSGQRVGAVLLAIAAATLLVLLAQEALQFDRETRTTPMAGWAIVLVVAVQILLAVEACRFALDPEREPLGLSERGRQVYVYGVELLLLLIFLHLRFNVPELFRGVVGRFWPLIVMGIAFLGIGLSDFFRRRGLPVLAGPLYRTGVLLPIVPLGAFWVRVPDVVKEQLARAVPGLDPLLNYFAALQERFGLHASLWFLLAVLYLFLAQVKRTAQYVWPAALAATFGLWVLFASHDELAFARHPQLWLIPLGLVLLLAEHINRDRLAEYQAASLRYVALLFIYVSSTADMFIEGLGESWALPLALAALSVVGVLVGILLRVRAFLFAGVAFLFLVVFTQIWHAAMDLRHYWLWWACGILLGGAIIALFALFEKRKNDVLRVVEELKQWK